MANLCFYRFFLLAFLLVTGSTALLANTGRPRASLVWNTTPAIAAVTDTVPANGQTTADKSAKKDAEVVKAVPRSRKQEKPIAITTVAIKPIIVKPTIIIKPIIKIH